MKVKASAGCLGLIVVLVSCGNGEGAENGPPDGIATREVTTEGGDSGLLSGTLVMRDGCYYVEDEDGLWLPIFPQGLVESGQEDGQITVNGEAFTPGDEIRLQGSPVVDDPFDIPSTCDGDVPQWTVHPEG